MCCASSTDWRRHYNDDRPHSAIGYNVPSALHLPGGVFSPPPRPRPKAPASNGP
ncbi:integrase core domain-containing protein [Paracoccus cavernae]|uniref:integrase core domain-containing protein n=1 Tax=Paracoccus cavernae TaxID=1571207 RepID=UPI0035F44404